MAENSVIQHKGIVSETEGSQVKVSIISHSACSSCHAKSACGMGDSKEMVIEIDDTEQKFHKGEEVTVSIEQNMGTKAVLYGYLFPFLVILFSLIILISLTEKEGLSALISISLLVPYYSVLYYFRNRLKKTFSFKIQKIY